MCPKCKKLMTINNLRLSTANFNSGCPASYDAEALTIRKQLRLDSNDELNSLGVRSINHE